MANLDMEHVDMEHLDMEDLLMEDILMVVAIILDTDIHHVSLSYVKPLCSPLYPL